MKAWKKRAIAGALWGLASVFGFGSQLTAKPMDQIGIIYHLIYLPASLSARTIIIWPIFSIVLGVLIALLAGYVYDT